MNGNPSDNKTSEHDLMNRCRDGDSAAFAELVHRWDSRVCRVLGRLTGNRAEVEDLRQEVFLRVLRAAPRYHANGSFSTWIYRIVLNLARDAARRRRPVEPLDEQTLMDFTPDPAVSAQQRELAAQVGQVLAELPQPLREVLVLKHFGNLTFAEIAGVLGEPASTVKSRARVALSTLHHQLSRRGLSDEELFP
jgi:RNA polymerase sigma-70 factor (ECF subfamily)